MIEPDLQKQLEAINSNLVEIKNKKNPGVWRSFFNGMFGALGYLLGLAIVIGVLGWVLNITGTLPAFKKQISNFQTFLARAEQIAGAAQSQQGSTSTGK